MGRVVNSQRDMVTCYKLSGFRRLSNKSICASKMDGHHSGALHAWKTTSESSLPRRTGSCGECKSALLDCVQSGKFLYLCRFCLYFF